MIQTKQGSEIQDILEVALKSTRDPQNTLVYALDKRGMQNLLFVRDLADTPEARNRLKNLGLDYDEIVNGKKEE